MRLSTSANQGLKCSKKIRTPVVMITDNVPEGRKNFALRDFARDMFYDGVAWDNRLFQRLRPHTLGVQRATQSFG